MAYLLDAYGNQLTTDADELLTVGATVSDTIAEAAFPLDFLSASLGGVRDILMEASLELQGAIVTALKASAEVTTLINGRVFDRVDEHAGFPYVTVGDDQVTQAHADCLDGSVEVFTNLHAWSRAPGKVEVKKIAGAVVRALNLVNLPLLNGYRLVLMEHDNTQHLADPDGITSHSVIVFHAFIDEV